MYIGHFPSRLLTHLRHMQRMRHPPAPSHIPAHRIELNTFQEFIAQLELDDVSKMVSKRDADLRSTESLTDIANAAANTSPTPTHASVGSYHDPTAHIE